MNRPGTVVAGAASQVPEEVTMLTVTVQELDDDVILRCLGKIVRGEETAILCAAVRHRGRNVILDLGGVDAIDAAGIGLLIALQAAGIYLQLLNPTRRVQEILQVTKLDSVFEICESQSADDCITNPATNKESRATRRDGSRSLPSLIPS
jgi:anti-sigma B factor antagonist